MLLKMNCAQKIKDETVVEKSYFLLGLNKDVAIQVEQNISQKFPNNTLK